MKRGYQYGGLSAEQYTQLLGRSPDLAQREARFAETMGESQELTAESDAFVPASMNRTAFDQREAQLAAAEQSLVDAQKERRLNELRLEKARRDAAAQGMNASDYSDLIAYYESEVAAPQRREAQNQALLQRAADYDAVLSAGAGETLKFPAVVDTPDYLSTQSREAQNQALLQQAAAADAQIRANQGATRGLMSDDEFYAQLAAGDEAFSAAMSKPVEPVATINPSSYVAPSSVEPVAPTPGLMERLDSAQASIDAVSGAAEASRQLREQIKADAATPVTEDPVFDSVFDPALSELESRKDSTFAALDGLATAASLGEEYNPDGTPIAAPPSATSSTLSATLAGVNEAVAAAQGIDLQELVQQRRRELILTGEMRPALSPEARQMLFAQEAIDRVVQTTDPGNPRRQAVMSMALPNLRNLAEIEDYVKAVREGSLNIDALLEISQQARQGVERSIYDGRITYDQLVEAIQLRKIVDSGVRSVIPGSQIAIPEKEMQGADLEYTPKPREAVAPQPQRRSTNWAVPGGTSRGSRTVFAPSDVDQEGVGDGSIEFVEAYTTKMAGPGKASVQVVTGEDIILNPDGATLEEYEQAKARLQDNPLSMFTAQGLAEFLDIATLAPSPGGVGEAFQERVQKGLEPLMNKGGLMQPTGYNDGGYVRLPRTNLDAYAQRVMENRRIADMQRPYDEFNRPNQQGSAAIGAAAAEFVPGVGDVMAFTDAAEIAANPEASNFAKAAALGLAGLGLVPVVGDVASKAGRTAIRRGMQDDAIRIQEDPTIPTTRAAEQDTLRAREGFAATQQEMLDPNFPAVPGYQYQSIPIEYPELLPLPAQPPVRTLQQGVTGFDPAEAAQYRDARILVEQENARRLAEYDAARQQQIQADIAMRERSVSAQQPAATEAPAPTTPQETGLMSNPTAERARPPARPQRGTMGDRERMNQELGEAVASLEALDAPSPQVRDVAAETDQMIKEADDLVDQITGTDTSAKRGFGGFSINNLEDLTDQWSRGNIADSEYRSQLKSMGVRIGGLKGNVDLDPSALVFELPDGKRVRGIENI